MLARNLVVIDFGFWGPYPRGRAIFESQVSTERRKRPNSLLGSECEKLGHDLIDLAVTETDFSTSWFHECCNLQICFDN